MDMVLYNGIVISTLVCIQFCAAAAPDTSRLPEGYKFAPGVDLEWYKRQGRPQWEYEYVLEGIQELEHKMGINRNVTKQAIFTPDEAGVIDDIIVTADLIDELLGRNRREKRQILDFFKYTGNSWNTNSITYKIDTALYTDEEQSVIRAAFTTVASTTCFTFTEVDKDTVVNVNHVLVTKLISNNIIIENACRSPIGKNPSVQPPTPQALWLGSNCLNVVYQISTHELGHTLGLLHTHQRVDRDNYVTVNLQNVLEGAEHNFIKDEDTITFNLPYNYNSMMGYGSTDFSIDKNTPLYTIETKDPRLMRTIGQRSMMDYDDSHLLNLMHCTDACSGVQPPACVNGGHQDPNDCSRH